MSIKAEVEGIGTMEFPDGTDPSVIQQVVKTHIAAKDTGEKSDKVHPAFEIFGPTEAAAQMVTGAAGAVVGGLAGLAGGDPKAIQESMTYQPRTDSGKMISGAIAAPFNALAKGADAAGQALMDKGYQDPEMATFGDTTKGTVTPAMAAGANTAIQAAPMLLGLKGAKVASGAGAATAAKAAEAYAGRIGLVWNDLAAKTRETLTSIAKDSKNLDNLDPTAVKRVARAQAVGAPISRGQATRSLEQLTHEENISRAASGKPVREINTAQDLALHKKLDTVRPPSKVETRSQLGESVQGAERAKLRTLEADYRAKYRKAKQGGETASPVDATPLDDWLNVPANKRNAGFLRQALEDYKKDASGSIRINDLEEVRKEANVKVGSADKTEAHYAKQAVKVIDDILDQAGGDAYKTARKAFAKTKAEFDRQGLIKSLTSEKGRTTDRAVALEDTFDKVVRSGSNEQLKGLIDSLTKGGTKKTQARGAVAVDDLRAATIDYLKEKAAGKRAIRGEDEQLQFNSSFIDAVDELDKDGKLDTLFGPAAKATLRQLREATRDLRTKPADRIAGPNTTPRMIAMIDKLSHVPGMHTIGTVIKKGAEKLHEAADAKAATVNPLEQAAKDANQAVKRKNTLQDLQRAAPSAAPTLQDQQ
ncbi:MAG TPA: hypothetical protein VN879_15875 [Candidatus Acidoferrales bacterium]|nr:hypothetical protein [Candidatus Acidoferrales bacterium]